MYKGSTGKKNMIEIVEFPCQFIKTNNWSKQNTLEKDVTKLSGAWKEASCEGSGFNSEARLDIKNYHKV